MKKSGECKFLKLAVSPSNSGISSEILVEILFLILVNHNRVGPLDQSGSGESTPL